MPEIQGLVGEGEIARGGGWFPLVPPSSTRRPMNSLLPRSTTAHQPDRQLRNTNFYLGESALYNVHCPPLCSYFVVHNHVVYYIDDYHISHSKDTKFLGKNSLGLHKHVQGCVFWCGRRHLKWVHRSIFDIQHYIDQFLRAKTNISKDFFKENINIFRGILCNLFKKIPKWPLTFTNIYIHLVPWSGKNGLKQTFCHSKLVFSCVLGGGACSWNFSRRLCYSLKG